jgi:ubiquitin-protein ligase
MNNSVDGEDLITDEFHTAKGSPPASPLLYTPRGSESEQRGESPLPKSRKSIPVEKTEVSSVAARKPETKEEPIGSISIAIPDKYPLGKPSKFQFQSKIVEEEKKPEVKEIQEKMNEETWRFIYSVPNVEAKTKIMERSNVSKPLRLGLGGLLKGVGHGSRQGTPKEEGGKKKVVLPLLCLKTSGVEAQGTGIKSDKVMLVDNLRQTKLDHLAEYMEKNQMMSGLGLMEMITSIREDEETAVNASEMKESNLGRFWLL